MGDFVFSASKNMFFISSMKERYDVSGMWPDDAVEVSEEDVETYTAQPPDGMCRGSDDQGLPVWVEI